jgi:hypothetical protein
LEDLGINGELMLKWMLNGLGGFELVSFVPGYGPMVGYCQHGYEHILKCYPSIRVEQMQKAIKITVSYFKFKLIIPKCNLDVLL